MGRIASPEGLNDAIERGLVRPASSLAARSDPGMTRRFLELLRNPEAGCTELRVLRAGFDRWGQVCRSSDHCQSHRGSTLAGWFTDVERLTAQARRLREVSGYVTINPVCPDLLARSDHRLCLSRHTTRDVDIAVLRWLFLDIDPVRPPDISSTDAECKAAIARRDDILSGEPELANSALWGCSGNGAWILVRLPDYPNDPFHRDLVVQTVRKISGKYTDAAVQIDQATVNPARLIGLPGTLKAKGSPRPDRPWRVVTLDGMGPRAPAPTR
jgi:hypothetical protein